MFLDKWYNVIKMNVEKQSSLVESRSKNNRNAEGIMTGLITKRWNEICGILKVDDRRFPMIQFKEAEESKFSHVEFGAYIPPGFEARRGLPSSNGVGWLLIERSRLNLIVEMEIKDSKARERLRDFRDTSKKLARKAQRDPRLRTEESDIRQGIRRYRELIRDFRTKLNDVKSNLSRELEETLTHELIHLVCTNFAQYIFYLYSL